MLQQAARHPDMSWQTLHHVAADSPPFCKRQWPCRSRKRAMSRQTFRHVLTHSAPCHGRQHAMSQQTVHHVKADSMPCHGRQPPMSWQTARHVGADSTPSPNRQRAISRQTACHVATDSNHVTADSLLCCGRQHNMSGKVVYQIDIKRQKLVTINIFLKRL